MMHNPHVGIFDEARISAGHIGVRGLIPSVAGGLLGMNVKGNPWSVTLGQVAFGIAMSMATALYVFARKGWLR